LIRSLDDTAGWSADEHRLYARVEDAGLNASATQQQLWADGWLLRFSPGKAKRARCINAVAPGHGSLDARLAHAKAFYARAALPLMFRITPFTQPAGLDAILAERGFESLDDTRVMVCRDTAAAARADVALPPGHAVMPVGALAFAQAVAALRGSTLAQQQAHAQRLEQSPLAWRAFVIRRQADGRQVAAGQVATEGDLVGVYDVNTDFACRNQGLATHLCKYALSRAMAEDKARVAYLQVDADNTPARSIYLRLGFFDAYRYHYRVNGPPSSLRSLPPERAVSGFGRPGAADAAPAPGA
jgi:ribosomal protein S18 acetylase RimI-like enzyme